jgi:hypothetical protein
LIWVERNKSGNIMEQGLLAENVAREIYAIWDVKAGGDSNGRTKLVGRLDKL